MNKAIVGQATKRLAAAQKKASGLANARNPEEIEELWSEFLTEHTRFFNRLGHAMDSAAERERWAKLTADRAANPLTAYLMQARNADEHGRALITTRAGNLSAGAPGESVAIDNLVIENGVIKQVSIRPANPGEQIHIRFSPSEVFPVAVTNRGVTYRIPDTMTVVELARYGIQHLQSVLSAATAD